MRELPQKILVIRLSSIGDIVLTSPLLRIIRKKVGDNARIDFAIKKEFSELVKSSHHISVVHELDTSVGFKGLKELKGKIQIEKYDLIVDLQNNLRSIYVRNLIGVSDVVSVNKMIWERIQLVYFKKNIYPKIFPVSERYISTLQEYGIEDDGKGLEIFIPDEIQFGIASKIATLKLKNYEKTIALCPGAKHNTKRWQKEKFAELGIKLANEFHAKIILFGDKNDESICNEISKMINNAIPNSCTDYSGQFTILQTAAAIEFCDVVVSNDSALMHIAAAKQKPVVAIFGSTVKEFGFIPFQTKYTIVETNDVPCRPCSHIGKANCPKEHFNCMNLISTKEVFVEIKKILI